MKEYKECYSHACWYQDEDYDQGRWEIDFDLRHLSWGDIYTT